MVRANAMLLDGLGMLARHLPSYDVGATKLLTERVLDFLARVG